MATDKATSAKKRKAFALAARKVCTANYLKYVEIVNSSTNKDADWIPGKHLLFLCNKVQEFVEKETGNAYDILILNLPPQHGKQVSDDTLVLTRKGWKQHGDLVVGDYVISNNGKFVRVTHVHPKYDENVLVTFSNGEQIHCHENHEWYVYDRHAVKHKTVETKYMMERNLYDGTLNKRGCHFRFQLPINSFVQGEHKELTVEPYTFGAWLGDGSNQKPAITGAKEDRPIIDAIEKDGYPVSAVCTHNITGVLTTYFKILSYKLRDIGFCFTKKRVEKYIPAEYLTASIEQRLQLLAGLLDTDGSLHKPTKRYTFTTSDVKLKNDFIK